MAHIDGGLKQLDMRAGETLPIQKRERCVSSEKARPCFLCRMDAIDAISAAH